MTARKPVGYRVTGGTMYAVTYDDERGFEEWVVTDAFDIDGDDTTDLDDVCVVVFMVSPTEWHSFDIRDCEERVLN